MIALLQKNLFRSFHGLDEFYDFGVSSDIIFSCPEYRRIIGAIFMSRTTRVVSFLLGNRVFDSINVYENDDDGDKKWLMLRWWRKPVEKGKLREPNELCRSFRHFRSLKYYPKVMLTLIFTYIELIRKNFYTADYFDPNVIMY